jgi:surface antigen
MKKILPFIIVLAVIAVSVIILKKVLRPPQVMSPSEKARSIVLGKVTESAQSELTHADKDFAHAAKEISLYELTSDSVRSILKGLHARHSFIVDCCIVDTNGIMIVVEPEEFKSFEGHDISDQAQVQKIHQTHMPVMSSAFLAVEGFQAVDIQYPILSEDNTFIGSISMLIRADSMLVDIIKPIIKGVPVNIWVMQKDGIILYDRNKEEIGRNLFTDEMYTPYENLRMLGQEIIENKTGLGSYTFLSDTMTEPVEKMCFWNTTGLYDMQWKLVLTSVLSGAEAPKGSKESVKYIQKNLKNFVQQIDLLAALSENDEESIKICFENFYAAYPYIYSIQWTDTSATSRFGTPQEHSLLNYNFRETRDGINEQYQKFISAVENKESAVLEKNLLEGDSAIFILEPVFSPEQYFGIIYVMVLK